MWTNAVSIMAEFILETNYPSRRIIRQTDNSSKYKSEDEFWRIFCLHILRVLHDGYLVLIRGSLARDQKQYGGTHKLFDFHLFCLKFLLQCFFEYPQIFLHFEDCFSVKRSTTVDHPTTSSVLKIKYNFFEDVRISVCPSQLVFLYFFEEAVALLDAILK